METNYDNNLTIMPQIADLAPDFEAVPTIEKLKFSDYNKDSWVILFSHPIDKYEK